MAITRRAAKAKGRKSEQMVVDKLLEAFPDLTNQDIYKVAAACAGEDIIFSTKARDLLDISVEVKARAKMSVYSYHEQCVKNAGDHQPVTIIKADRKKPLAVIDMDYFISLLCKNDLTSDKH